MTAAATAMAFAVCLAVSAAASAQGRPGCIPGSIGSGGCDSIRPEDQPLDRPEFMLPPEIDRPLDALRRRLEAVRGVPSTRVGRVRPDPTGRDPLRGVEPSLPAPREPVLLGQQPPSMRTYQLPYAD